MKKLLYLYFITLISVSFGASPYAPESITDSPLGDLTFGYNTMGQRQDYTSQGTQAIQSIEWGLIGKPVKIMTTGMGGQSFTEAFSYGSDGRRYLRQHADGSKTFYVGGMEYRIGGSKPTQSIVYIRNGAYSPVAKVDTSSATPQCEYFLRDHLGSSLITVDDNGAVLSNKSHGRSDLWGQPWGAGGFAEDESKEDSRSFTGHENIASSGLIHMNGRVYDPMIGQFTGPDKFLQNASRGGGLNRYAYIGNSPVNGTDPSGWVGVSSFLNKRNLDAIADYTGKNYKNWWNTASQYPHSPDALVPNSGNLMLSDLDTAIRMLNQRLQLSENKATRTFSGIPLSDQSSKDLMSLEKGQIYLDKRYVSTSWEERVALSYASMTEVGEETENGVTGIFLDIIGRSGADISGMSIYPMEAELLYGRNIQFVCHSCEPEKIIGSRKYRYLNLREVGVPEDILVNPNNIITFKNRPLPERPSKFDGVHRRDNSIFNNAVKRKYPHARFNSWGILATPLH